MAASTSEDFFLDLTGLNLGQIIIIEEIAELFFRNALNFRYRLIGHDY